MKHKIMVATALAVIVIVTGAIFQYQSRLVTKEQAKLAFTHKTEPAINAVSRWRAQLHSVPAKQGPQKTNWYGEFYNTNDYFSFVRSASSAAQRGDARASFYVSVALRQCVLVKKLYADAADPEAQLRDDLQKRPYTPQWEQDRQTRNLHKCLRLAKEDPFVELPPRAGGYWESKYWGEQALAAGDSMAQAEASGTELASLLYSTGDAASKRETLDRVQSYVARVVGSGDPEAIFRVGQILANPVYSADPMRGIAMSIAACELGYDCSGNNPSNEFAVCKESGECPADADYSYYVRKGLGEEQYAAAYARAQQFTNLLAQPDASQIAAFTRINGTVAANVSKGVDSMLN